MTFRIEKIEGIWYIGQEAAAEVCGVSDNTFRKWLGQPEPPPWNGRLAMAPLAELGDWIGRKKLFKTGRGGGFPYMPDLSRLQGQSLVPGLDPGTGAADVKIDKLAEEARLTKLRADKVALEIAEQEARLVDADMVRDGWVKLVTQVKTRLMKLPTSLAPLVTGETDPFKVQKTLDAGVREALEGLSKSDANDKDDP